MNLRWLAVAATAIALAALYRNFAPEPSLPAMPPPEPEAAASDPVAGTKPDDVTTAPVDRTDRFELTLSGGTPVGGPQTFNTVRGRDIVITLRGDTNDEAHLHGYDLHAPLQPGEPATLAFTAEHTGRFELELHHGGGRVAVLEVQPD